jgi:hypothetical protein
MWNKGIKGGMKKIVPANEGQGRFEKTGNQ